MSVTARQQSVSRDLAGPCSQGVLLRPRQPGATRRGLGWIPFGWPLGALTALASLVYGVRTFRRPRARGSTWLAAAGIVLAFLALTAFLWISIWFTIDPPE